MDGNPMRDDLLVFDLATRARNGEKQAWDAIIERYSPLIWSICCRHQLGGSDAEDVGRAVWLQLVSKLADLRDPAALPGWLAATTRRECYRVLHARCGTRRDTENIPDDDRVTVEHELVLAKRNATLREALTRLPPDHQQLLALLMADPRMPDAEISARLGLSAEDIGPLRSRCLNELRCDPAIATLIGAEAQAQAARTDRPR
jgi:RNA polymerase sigma factor (sigma-70 family)